MKSFNKNEEIKKPDIVALSKELGIDDLSFNGLNVNDDYNKTLTGTSRVKVYDNMRRGDSTISALIKAVKLPLLKANWYVETDEVSRKGEEIKDFVKCNILENKKFNFSEWLNEALNYLIFGSYVFEKVLEFENDKVVLSKLSTRHPSTIYAWKLKDGKTDGIVQTTPKGTFEIPKDKLFILVNEKEGANYEGISLLRAPYKNWKYKEGFYLVDAIGAERQAVGIPMAKSTKKLSEAEKAQVEEVLENMRANEKAYVIVGPNIEISMLEMKGGDLKQIQPSIEHHNREITKSFLAQFLELGAGGGGGSYALSKSTTDLFLDSLESIVNYITGNLNILVKELVDYNYNDVKVYPTIKVEKIRPTNVKELTDAIAVAINGQFLTPDDNIEATVREAMDLPEKEKEVELDSEFVDNAISELNEELGQQDQPQDLVQDPVQAMEELEGVLTAGVTGQPLSEETKKKISEALKKLKSAKTSGKVEKSPEYLAKKAEIGKLRQKISDFASKYKERVLQSKVNGEKLSPKKVAQFQLEVFQNKSKISKEIAKLKGEMDAMSANDVITFDDYTESLSKLKERVDNIIDAEE